MKIYFACPTGKRREHIVSKYDDKFGACLTRDVFNKVTSKVMPWFFDNGAFGDWKNNKEFDFHKFTKKLLHIEADIRYSGMIEPDFVVIPDKVAKGKQSLEYSNAWLPYLNQNFPYFKYYLAVQDGMDERIVEKHIRRRMYDGLFVGGTKKRQYETSEKWIQLAHEYGLKCHIGGIGTPKDIRWAEMIGADSVDSGIAMIHSKYLEEVLEIENTSLFWAA